MARSICILSLKPASDPLSKRIIDVKRKHTHTHTKSHLLIHQGSISDLVKYLRDESFLQTVHSVKLLTISSKILHRKFLTGSQVHFYRDHSFITFTKFSEKLTFLTPRYAPFYVRISGCKKR